MIEKPETAARRAAIVQAVSAEPKAPRIIRHRPAVMRHWGHSHEITVSLPAPPWGALDPDDRAETAPCAAPIRLAGFDPLKADPVIRHADARRDRG